MAEMTAQSDGPQRRWRRWVAAVRWAGLLVGFVVLVAFLRGRASGFASMSNVKRIAADASLVAMAGAGLTVVIVGGGLDVSVGAILALASACSVLAVRAGWPVAAGVAIAVGLGAALGAANGAVSAVTRVPSIVVTLGALFLYRWLFLAALGGQRLDDVPEGMRRLAAAEIVGVQSLVWLAVVVVAMAFVGLRCHRFGRALRARGHDRGAAGASGIRTRWLLVGAFAVCGAMVGLAGVLWAGEYNRLELDLGETFLLQVIAAAAVGGAWGRGRGSVLATAAGAVLAAVIGNGMFMLDVPGIRQKAVFVAVIVGAVLFARVACLLTERLWR